MTERIVRSMLTRWSPYTEMRLAWLPIGGKLMNVPLSLMICLMSSRRSESIQSSLRGRIAVSREMMHLLCRDERERQYKVLWKSERGAGERRTLWSETWKSMSLARCTPKNSPVMKMRFCLAMSDRFFCPSTPESGVGK